jgi:hypothetical protein
MKKCSETWGTVKEAHSYLLHQWRFWSVAFVRNVSEPCVCILHNRPRGQGIRYSNVNALMLPQSTLLADATVTNRPVIQLLNQLQAVSTFTDLVLYHLWVCSIILNHTKTNTVLFFPHLPFKLVFAASLSSERRTIVLWGNLSPL